MPINSSDKKTNSKCIIYKVPNAYQCIARIVTLYHGIEITQEGNSCIDPRMPQAYHHDEQLRDWERRDRLGETRHFLIDLLGLTMWQKLHKGRLEDLSRQRGVSATLQQLHRLMSP
jgi:hypothetical protein